MEVIKSFYKLYYSEDEHLGVGYASENLSFDVLQEGRYIRNWTPAVFTLEDGAFADYQANDLGWALCSEKLKTIIDNLTSSVDSFQWLDAEVNNGNGRSQRYYILHFPERPTVLDRERTLFAAGDFVVKPCFSERAIGAHRVFSYPSGEFSVVVSDEVKDAIVAAGCSGMEFNRVLLSSY